MSASHPPSEQHVLPVTPPPLRSWPVRVVAAFLVGGGAIGVVGVVWQSAAIYTTTHAFSVRVPLIDPFPFIFAVVAGSLLLSSMRVGAHLSAVVLLFQVVSFRIADIEYQFATGLGLFLGSEGFVSSGIALKFRWSYGANWGISWLQAHQRGYFMLNVVAIAALVVVLRALLGKVPSSATPANPGVAADGLLPPFGRSEDRR